MYNFLCAVDNFFFVKTFAEENEVENLYTKTSLFAGVQNVLSTTAPPPPPIKIPLFLSGCREKIFGPFQFLN